MAFFGLAQQAGLGSYSIGRRGHPTRLEVARDALGQLIAESAFDPDPIDGIENGETDTYIENGSKEGTLSPEPVVETRQERSVAVERVLAPRVFISHSKNADVVDQIKTMLELASMDYEIAVEEETTAIPVPEKILEAMRRCTAAVICVTADDEQKHDDGRYSINENVLIEIGAAFVLYDRKVVLVWDRRIRVPSNLQGLYRCEFEGTELAWSTGMKFMKAINEFKNTERLIIP